MANSLHSHRDPVDILLTTLAYLFCLAMLAYGIIVLLPAAIDHEVTKSELQAQRILSGSPN